MNGIAVLGPGAVGGFLAAVLAHAGEPTTVVARESTAALIARTGITVQSASFGDFVAHPRAVATLEQAVDVLLVAPKATGLADALTRISGDCRLVVPLLNGAEHMALLRRRFGPERVAAGVIRIESDRPEPGRVIHKSPSARIDLATDQPALKPAVEDLADTLRRAGIPTRMGDSEAVVLWSKLVRLVALACTTSASERPIGFVRSDPHWRTVLRESVEEAAAVARAEGAAIEAADTMAELEDAHPELGSSMQRDIAAGREPELDAIAGAVLRAAARHGLACPTLSRLAVTIAARAGIPPPRGAVRPAAEEGCE